MSLRAVLTCDRCGEILVVNVKVSGSLSLHVLVIEANREGWQLGDKDYCPRHRDYILHDDPYPHDHTPAAFMAKLDASEAHLRTELLDESPIAFKKCLSLKLNKTEEL